MSVKKGAIMLNNHQLIGILIIFIIDFSIEKQNVLYRYGLIIAKRVF